MKILIDWFRIGSKLNLFWNWDLGKMFRLRMILNGMIIDFII